MQTKTDHLLSCLRGSFLPEKVTIIWLRQPQLHGKCFFKLEIRVRKTQTGSRRDSQIMKSTGNECETFTAWQILGRRRGGRGIHSFTVHLAYIWMGNSSPSEGLDIKNYLVAVFLCYIHFRSEACRFLFGSWKLTCLMLDGVFCLRLFIRELQGKTGKRGMLTGDYWGHYLFFRKIVVVERLKLLRGRGRFGSEKNIFLASLLLEL